MSRSSSIEWVWGLGGYLQNLRVNERDSCDRDTVFLRVAQGLEFKFRDFWRIFFCGKNSSLDPSCSASQDFGAPMPCTAGSSNNEEENCSEKWTFEEILRVQWSLPPCPLVLEALNLKIFRSCGAKFFGYFGSVLLFLKGLARRRRRFFCVFLTRFSSRKTLSLKRKRSESLITRFFFPDLGQNP